jgi:hypothetical protein
VSHPGIGKSGLGNAIMPSDCLTCGCQNSLSACTNMSLRPLPSAILKLLSDKLLIDGLGRQRQGCIVTKSGKEWDHHAKG